MNQAVADDYTVTGRSSLEPDRVKNAYELVNGSDRIVPYLPVPPPIDQIVAAWIHPAVFAFPLVPGTAHAQVTKGFVSQL
jgi:hypothetical protein